MAKAKSTSKKSESVKSKSQERREASLSEGQVEARPQHEGIDPLADGNTLVNPTNTEAETHYEVRERSTDVQATEAEASTVDGQAVSSDEQDEVVEGRVESDGKS